MAYQVASRERKCSAILLPDLELIAPAPKDYGAGPSHDNSKPDVKLPAGGPTEIPTELRAGVALPVGLKHQELVQLAERQPIRAGADVIHGGVDRALRLVVGMRSQAIHRRRSG